MITNKNLEVQALKKKLLKNILVSTMLVSSLASVTPVLADDYGDQLKEAELQAQEHEQAAESLNALMNQLTSEVTNTQSALNNLTNQIQKNEMFLKEAVIELERAHEEMTVLQDEITVLEENIEKRSGQLEEQARKIQVNGNSTTHIDFILSAESLTDIIARVDIVSKVVDTSNKMLDDQIRDKKAVLKKTEETERKIVQQNALAEELEKTSADLESQKVSQEALVAQLQIEQSTVASERDGLIAQRNEALQRAENIQSEREAVEVAIASAEAERETEAVQAQAASEPQENVTRPASSSAESAPVSNTTTESSSNSSSNTNSSNSSNSNNNSSTSSNNSQSTPAPAPAPAPKPKPKPQPAPTPAPSGNVLSVASQYLGVPYLYGGTTTSAFDCSGYTRHVFAQTGKSIPRVASAQYAASQKVSNPQPGDLVFFGQGSITHVGIYTGGGNFIGSQSSTGVAYASLTSGYWSSRVIGYGRY